MTLLLVPFLAWPHHMQKRTNRRAYPTRRPLPYKFQQAKNEAAQDEDVGDSKKLRKESSEK
ncbi:pentatricopeptide repeat-containing protein, putative [Anopheles sinensis]|uniref:Pentatricopeptide repeat-containing protein, putative n=1 Tax=Anopheles sinensis TaxID=74873 RepID=A0A084VPX7_ANOSI|nr:pentatricopeptide repeat-containing protein, putative [Anopheles sinensis]